MRNNTYKQAGKKFIAMLLSAIMILGIFPLSALAAEDDVCRIGETYYKSIEAAVATANSDDVITIIRNTSSRPLVVDGKSIEIDCGSFSVTINHYTVEGSYVGGVALLVRNSGNLKIYGDAQGYPDPGLFTVYADVGAKAESGGSIEIKGGLYGVEYGVWADGEGSSIIIDGSVQSEINDIDKGNLAERHGAYASNGGVIEIDGTVTSAHYGVIAESRGSVSVTGMIKAIAKYGAYALDGGTVNAENVWGGEYGLYAKGNGSNITASGAVVSSIESAVSDKFDGIGAFAEDGGVISIGDDVVSKGIGVQAAGAGSTVQISGKVTSEHKEGTTQNSIGAIASNGGKVTVESNVMGEDIGVWAEGAYSEVTVGGNASAAAAEGVVDYIGVKAEKGAHVTVAGDATGRDFGVMISEMLRSAAGTMDDLTWVKVGGNVGAQGNGGIGVYNGGGIVVVEGDINSGDVYITVGSQPMLGTSGEDVKRDDSKGAPDVLPVPDLAGYKDEYSWYYSLTENDDTQICHSFTLVKGNGDAAIGKKIYEKISDAFQEVKTGETIKLLRDIKYAGSLKFTNGRSFTIDLNNNDLIVASSGSDPAVLVANKTNVSLKGIGEFNVTGGSTGVKVESGGKVTVTNATANDQLGRAAHVGEGGGSITVLQDAVGTSVGAYVEGDGGYISVGSLDNGIAVGNELYGVCAMDGGTVHVYGDAVGKENGVYAKDHKTSVRIGRDAKATGENGVGVHAEDRASVSVGQDVISVIVGVEIIDNTPPSAFLPGQDVLIKDLANVIVGRNITVTGDGSKGIVNQGGFVVVEGIIEASTFILLPYYPLWEGEHNTREDKILKPDDSLEWKWLFFDYDDYYKDIYNNYNKYYYIKYEYVDEDGKPLLAKEYLDEDGNPLCESRHSFIFVNKSPSNAVAQLDDGRKFNDIDKAIKAIDKNEAVIKLLKDTYLSGGIVLADKKLTIDTNGHNLEIGGSTSGLSLDNSTFDVKGTGTVRVNGIETGVRLHNKSKATLTSAEAQTGTGAYVSEGSTLTLKEDAVGAVFGVEVLDKGSTANVRNALTKNNMDGVGAYVGDGASLTVKGNATGNKWGAAVENSGKLTVEGNAEGDDCGAIAFGKDSQVTVKGNATGNSLFGIGAYAEEKAKVSVELEARGGDYGAVAKQGGSVTVKSNAVGGSGGALAEDKGSSVTIDGISVGTSAGSFGAFAKNGGKVTAKSGAQGQLYGVTASGSAFDSQSGTGTPSKVDVTGDAVAAATGGTGAFASNGGTISIVRAKDVEGNPVAGSAGRAVGDSFGAYAYGAGSKITIADDVVAAGTGVDAREGGIIEITGKVQGGMWGAMAAGQGSRISVGKNVTATDPNDGYGVDARLAAVITVAGNVTASSAGASVESGGKITIDGVVNSSDCYVIVDELVREYSQVTLPTTKKGYLTYQNGESVVWVMGEDAPKIEITSFTLDKTSAPSSGGKVTASIRGKNLRATDADFKVAYDCGASKLGDIITATDSLVVMTFIIDPNLYHVPYIYPFVLLINGRETEYVIRVTQEGHPNAPVIDGNTLSGLTQFSYFSCGIAFDEEFHRLGYSWVAYGLPQGVNIDPNKGYLYGVPQVFGDYTVTFVLIDPSGETSVEVEAYLSIDPAGPVYIPSMDVPDAVEGEEFIATVTVEGGIAPYTWSASGLPGELVFEAQKASQAMMRSSSTVSEPATAYITGIPATAGRRMY